MLYAGQRLETPPPAGGLSSRADAHRPALPLAHVPVRLRLDGSQPLLRYEGGGTFRLSGFAGELLFFRQGHVHLGEPTVANLFRHRLEQLAWAERLFVEHFTADMSDYFSWPRLFTRVHHGTCAGYTITGRIRIVEFIPNRPQTNDTRTKLRISLTINPARLFQSATLVLGEMDLGCLLQSTTLLFGDEPAQWAAVLEKSIPLGRVLRSACPHSISPAELWTLTRDESSFQQPASAPVGNAEEVGPVPTHAPARLSAPSRKKPARRPGRKKPGRKPPSARKAKPRTSR